MESSIFPTEKTLVQNLSEKPTVFIFSSSWRQDSKKQTLDNVKLTYVFPTNQPTIPSKKEKQQQATTISRHPSTPKHSVARLH